MLRFLAARLLIPKNKHKVYLITRDLSQLDRKIAIEAVLKRSEVLKDKVTTISSSALSKYNEFVGFDEIENAYMRVTILQDELAKIQNERTKVQMLINHIAKDLSSLQEQIQDCKRGEAKYIDLMKKGEFVDGIAKRIPSLRHKFIPFRVRDHSGTESPRRPL